MSPPGATLHPGPCCGSAAPGGAVLTACGVQSAAHGGSLPDRACCWVDTASGRNLRLPGIWVRKRLLLRVEWEAVRDALGRRWRSDCCLSGGLRLFVGCSFLLFKVGGGWHRRVGLDVGKQTLASLVADADPQRAGRAAGPGSSAGTCSARVQSAQSRPGSWPSSAWAPALVLPLRSWCRSPPLLLRVVCPSAVCPATP